MQNASYVIMAGANRAEAILPLTQWICSNVPEEEVLNLLSLTRAIPIQHIHADKWLGIKVGTDLAFVLALTYVVIKEVLYNREFVLRI